MGPDTVRKFDYVGDASDFLIHENASPPRLHYAARSALGTPTKISFGQLVDNGHSLIIRDGGRGLAPTPKCGIDIAFVDHLDS